MSIVMTRNIPAAIKQWQDIAHWFEIKLHQEMRNQLGRDKDAALLNKGIIKGYRLGLSQAKKNLRLTRKGMPPVYTHASDASETMQHFILNMRYKLKENYCDVPYNNRKKVYYHGQYRAFVVMARMQSWNKLNH
jgi:hypothetical protein